MGHRTSSYRPSGIVGSPLPPSGGALPLLPSTSFGRGNVLSPHQASRHTCCVFRRTLVLYGFGDYRRILDALEKLSELSDLALQSGNLVDADCVSLAKVAPQLRRLSLHKNRNVSVEGFATLSERMTGLEEFVIDYSKFCRFPCRLHHAPHRQSP